MEFKKIVVGYWHVTPYLKEFEHNKEYLYSKSLLTRIVNKLVKLGQDVAIQQVKTVDEPYMIVWISDKGFKQR